MANIIIKNIQDRIGNMKIRTTLKKTAEIKCK